MDNNAKKMTMGAGMSRSQTVAFCGLAIALLAVSAWITVPFGPVPFTLQTMMMVFVLLLFPHREALISVFGYLAIGAVGIPVFSGMRGGIGVLLGTSGGFLYGFGIGACLAVLLLKAWREPEGNGPRLVREACAAVVFLAVSYFFGWLQLMFVADLGPAAAFAAGIAPFIVLDAIKLTVGVALAHAIKQAVPVFRTASKRA